ncbi:Uncharacterized protein Fot_40443 [Forsythia ovata]|uniref:Uncharacterized protein n=1 Tax=Forsythia ovata TaxID=205694 RepID=A0ABD1S7F1_9LAMI
MLEELPPCDSNDPCDIGCSDSFIPPLPFPFGTVTSIPPPRRAFLTAATAVHEDSWTGGPAHLFATAKHFSPSSFALKFTSISPLLQNQISTILPPLPPPSLSPFNIFCFSDLLLLASILLKDCNSFRHSSSVSTCNEEVLTRLVYVTGGVATASLSSLTTEDHERSRNGSPSSERLPSESVVGLGSSIIDVEIGRRFGFTCWRTRGQEDFLILSN